MYGAMLGDIIGSRFEFDRGNKSKDFTFFTRESEYTDDSVMTIAVAEAILTDIAAAMGETFYGCPEELKKVCEKRIEPEMREILKKFNKEIGR